MQAGVGAAGRHLVQDPVERQLAVGELAEHEPQRRNAVVIRPGHGDLDVAQLLDVSGSRATTIGPVPVAHARAVRQQRVVLLHERIGVRARSPSPRAGRRAPTG